MFLLLTIAFVLLVSSVTERWSSHSFLSSKLQFVVDRVTINTVMERQLVCGARRCRRCRRARDIFFSCNPTRWLTSTVLGHTSVTAPCASCFRQADTQPGSDTPRPLFLLSYSNGGRVSAGWGWICWICWIWAVKTHNGHESEPRSRGDVLLRQPLDPILPLLLQLLVLGE